jgi:MFS family permease
MASSVTSVRAISTLALLSLAYFLALVDRNVLTVLVDPIKRDIAISDTQFGLLQGMAFAVFYIAFALPLATLADRWNRKSVMVGGLTVWSLCTCFAGFARSFGGLFAARIGVGAGEGCLAPAAYSMFADLFDKRVLGRVIGVFHTVGGLGVGGATILGGRLYQHFLTTPAHPLSGLGLPPWGLTLVGIGAPGVLLAAVILFFVREPLRAAREKAAESPSARASVFTLLLDRQGLLLRLLLGNACIAIAATALLTWAPSYLIRVFDLNPGQAGVRMGTAAVASALVGPLIGGFLSDVLYKRYGERGSYMALVGLSVVLIAGFSLLPFAPNAMVVAALIGVIGAAYMATLSVLATTLQLQSVPALRARVSAVWLSLNALVGLGLGAFLVGLVTDQVFGAPTAVGNSIGLVAATSCALGGALISSLLFRKPLARAVA